MTRQPGRCNSPLQADLRRQRFGFRQGVGAIIALPTAAPQAKGG